MCGHVCAVLGVVINVLGTRGCGENTNWNVVAYTIESLRLFKQAFDVEFKVRPDHDTKTVLLSCLGTGFRNMAKAST